MEKLRQVFYLQVLDATGAEIGRFECIDYPTEVQMRIALDKFDGHQVKIDKRYIR